MSSEFERYFGIQRFTAQNSDTTLIDSINREVSQVMQQVREAVSNGQSITFSLDKRFFNVQEIRYAFEQTPAGKSGILERLANLPPTKELPLDENAINELAWRFGLLPRTIPDNKLYDFQEKKRRNKFPVEDDITEVVYNIISLGEPQLKPFASWHEAFIFDEFQTRFRRIMIVINENNST